MYQKGSRALKSPPGPGPPVHPDIKVLGVITIPVMKVNKTVEAFMVFPVQLVMEVFRMMLNKHVLMVELIIPIMKVNKDLARW